MNLIAYELQPSAPGRDGTQVTQPSQGAPSPGPAPAGGGGGMGMILLMFVPMLLVLFLLNRSQSKKQRELEGKLKRGDRVVTSSGLIGKITELGTKYARLELAPGVKVQLLKSSIQGLDTGEEPAPSAKDTKSEAPGKDAPTETKK